MRGCSRPLTALATCLVAAVALMAQPASAVADRDCADFATQAAAQAFYVAAGAGDPHRLDSNGDGVACETLPCPCVTTPAPFVGSTTPAPSATPTPAPTSTPTVPAGAPGTPLRERGTVVRVSDGDTIVVSIGNTEQRVRIVGIDTPEVYYSPECGGPQASRRMKKLAPVGSRVRLVSDPTQAQVDRYGRLLRYVHRGGRDLGLAQVKSGWATAYVYDNVPFQRTARYRRAEAAARAADRGIWGRCA